MTTPTLRSIVTTTIDCLRDERKKYDADFAPANVNDMLAASAAAVIRDVSQAIAPLPMPFSIEDGKVLMKAIDVNGLDDRQRSTVLFARCMALGAGNALSAIQSVVNLTRQLGAAGVKVDVINKVMKERVPESIGSTADSFVKVLDSCDALQSTADKADLVAFEFALRSAADILPSPVAMAIMDVLGKADRTIVVDNTESDAPLPTVAQILDTLVKETKAVRDAFGHCQPDTFGEEMDAAITGFMAGFARDLPGARLAVVENNDGKNDGVGMECGHMNPQGKTDATLALIKSVIEGTLNQFKYVADKVELIYKMGTESGLHVDKAGVVNGYALKEFDKRMKDQPSMLTITDKLQAAVDAGDRQAMLSALLVLKDSLEPAKAV